MISKHTKAGAFASAFGCRVVSSAASRTPHHTCRLPNCLIKHATVHPCARAVLCCAVQAQSLVHDFSPQEISNLLWAYAKLGVRPPQMLLVALWESVGIGTATPGSSSSGGSGGAWGSSGSVTGSSSRGAWGSSGSGSVGARLSAFKPQELAMLVWALAVLKLVPGGGINCSGTCCC